MGKGWKEESAKELVRVHTDAPQCQNLIVFKACASNDSLDTAVIR